MTYLDVVIKVLKGSFIIGCLVGAAAWVLILLCLLVVKAIFKDRIHSDILELISTPVCWIIILFVGLTSVYWLYFCRDIWKAFLLNVQYFIPSALIACAIYWLVCFIWKLSTGKIDNSIYRSAPFLAFFAVIPFLLIYSLFIYNGIS